NKVPETQLGRVHPELLGDPVEVNLERESGLRRAMPALRSAGRFAPERSCALELVTWEVIGDRLQRARVVRARDTVGAVAAAVEQPLEVHRGCRAVFFHPWLHPVE